jgi:oxygen-independent coproporphyrinogen-3 oxidase
MGRKLGSDLKKLQEKAESPPFGLYLHIPFCARSCDFCAFYQEAPRRADLDAFLETMAFSLERTPPARTADTAFWGGGTPGLLPAADIEFLGNAMLQSNGGRQPVEWTVEMAPSTVKADRLAVMEGLGVTRISVGIQSFQEALLERLGRIHTRRQVEHALSLLAEARFASTNIDLIFAIPGQSLDDWRADLRAAIEVNPDHISTYCLTFEEDTALWVRLQQGTTEKWNSEAEAAYYELAWEELELAGYRQYEVSNFAKPGAECLHNIHTWQMYDWIGHGPSAASQLEGSRWTELAELQDWRRSLKEGPRVTAERRALLPEDLLQDALLFGLRMNAGILPKDLSARFSCALPPDWSSFEAGLLDNGLAERFSVDGLRLTPAGRLLADAIAVEIIQLAWPVA